MVRTTKCEIQLLHLQALYPESTVWIYEDIEEISFVFKELTLY